MKYGLKITARIVLTITGVLFLVPILGNIHNAYLRILSQATVKITNLEGTSGATGFVVRGNSGEKYIMTNGHVCDLGGSSKVLYATYHNEEFPVEVYKRYVWNDLCAIKAHRPLGIPVHIASFVKDGETIFAIGHPLLEPTAVTSGELAGSVFIDVKVGENVDPLACSGPTYRIIDLTGTLLGAFGYTNFCVRTLEANPSTVSIQPGNSGSPVVNIFGSVVAVVFAGNNSGRSYLVPLEDLKIFLREL